MDLNSVADKPHAICIPYPAQGHINPMFKLAKLLHLKGFHITFVNTEYNHRRLLKSIGPNHLEALLDFRFETIPDGLPFYDADVTQDTPSLCDSTSKYCFAPFCNLIRKLNDTSSSKFPPVTCIVSDGSMSFTVDAAEEFGIPDVLFWTPSACGLLCYTQFHLLVERGLTPLKDVSYLTNEYLETTVDWIPGMKSIRLRDFPAFIRTTDANDIMVNYIIREVQKASKASAIVLNTFDSLEQAVLDALSVLLPPVYTIGPLPLLTRKAVIRISTDFFKCAVNKWNESPVLSSAQEDEKWSELHDKMLQGSAQLLGLLVWRVQREGVVGDKCEVLHKLETAKKEIVELRKLRSEDAKANEKVVSIFATQAQTWFNERKKLQQHIELLLMN
ncbi:hypothetical protein Pint_26581 [Pistacia integerrima]|uniref:Uncharacterized protein n=1 Tax=Pistacia integerrima TaxID=434235 RepID=A0ACC0YR69_9ROSI|nr:hypothetical protein Pint_26581 [Pistacia integerrima]